MLGGVGLLVGRQMGGVGSRRPAPACAAQPAVRAGCVAAARGPPPKRTASVLDATVSSRATAVLPPAIVVSVTLAERVVGMQQNTASPSAISGGCSGRRTTASAASGVTSSTASRPYATAAVLRRAARLSPRCSSRPEMKKMPMVAAGPTPAAAAAAPAAGTHHLRRAWVVGRAGPLCSWDVQSSMARQAVPFLAGCPSRTTNGWAAAGSPQDDGQQQAARKVVGGEESAQALQQSWLGRLHWLAAGCRCRRRQRRGCPAAGHWPRQLLWALQWSSIPQ